MNRNIYYILKVSISFGSFNFSVPLVSHFISPLALFAFTVPNSFHFGVLIYLQNWKPRLASDKMFRHFYYQDRHVLSLDFLLLAWAWWLFSASSQVLVLFYRDRYPGRSICLYSLGFCFSIHDWLFSNPFLSFAFAGWDSFERLLFVRDDSVVHWFLLVACTTAMHVGLVRVQFWKGFILYPLFSGCFSLYW